MKILIIWSTEFDPMYVSYGIKIHVTYGFLLVSCIGQLMVSYCIEIHSQIRFIRLLHMERLKTLKALSIFVHKRMQPYSQHVPHDSFIQWLKIFNVLFIANT